MATELNSIAPVYERRSRRLPPRRAFDTDGVAEAQAEPRGEGAGSNNADQMPQLRSGRTRRMSRDPPLPVDAQHSNSVDFAEGRSAATHSGTAAAALRVAQ